MQSAKAHVSSRVTAWQAALLLLVISNPTSQAISTCIQGKTCKEVHGLFDLPADAMTEDCKVVTPADCEEVIYMNCQHGARNSHFHRFRDCILKMYPLIRYTMTSTATKKCAIVNHSVAAYIELFNIDNLEFFISDRSDFCLKTARGVREVHCAEPCVMDDVVIEPGFSELGERFAERHNALEMRRDVRELYHEDAHAGSDFVPRILILDRPNHSRNIRDFDAVVEAFREHFKEHTVEVSTANDLESALRAAVSANVLVHYHGAAGIHSVFMQSQAVVVEWSTFQAADMSKPWRTNEIVVRRCLWPELTWFTQWLPPEKVIDDLDVLRTSDDPYRVMKNGGDVDLDNADIMNAVSVIKEVFRRRQIARFGAFTI